MPDTPEPSDTEIAHQPNEGSSVRDPRLDRNASADQNGGNLERPGKNLSKDYGDRLVSGATDRKTAGAEAADRLPEDAVQTPAEETSAKP